MDIVFAKLPKHNFRKNLLKSGYWEKYEAVYKIAALAIYSTYWTDRIAQTALLWSKTTLITGGVGGTRVDPPS